MFVSVKNGERGDAIHNHVRNEYNQSGGIIRRRQNSMVQGATYLLRIKPAVSLDIVSEIIFTFAVQNSVKVTKAYPADTTITDDGCIGIPLMQDDTLALDGIVWLEAQYIFTNNAVGKTVKKALVFRQSQYTKTVDDETADTQPHGVYNLDMSDPVIVVIVKPDSSSGGSGGSAAGTGDMERSVYDPTGKAADIYAYADHAAESKVLEHDTKADSHGDIRQLISGLSDRLNALAEQIPDESGTGGTAAGYPVVVMTASAAELTPNTYYKWGEAAALDITLAEPADTGVTNEYCFEFVSGETATTLTVPDTVKWVKEPEIEAGKTYQVSILNGVGVICGA